jgi:hypothetical protein
MKNFRTLCASTVLILYALLAGASIDSNGDFEGWFLALCIIVPFIIILGIVLSRANLDAEKDNARKNIPNTYTLECEGDHSEFYYDSEQTLTMCVEKSLSVLGVARTVYRNTKAELDS